MTYEEIQEYLLKLSDTEIAEHSQRFFKTGEGEYGEGDKFLGIRVPVIRKAVKRYKDASLDVITKLLGSEYHEIRLFSLLMMVHRYSKSQEQRKDIYDLYLSNTKYINNWDLVDSSAHYIVGAYLEDKDRSVLYSLVNSKSLWERRISILSTFYFIKNNDYKDSLLIAQKLLHDKEDLIHKAVGWMLREIGNRDLEAEESFLKKHYKIMPRTMLRYAIEKFDEKKRQKYLKGEI